MHINKKIFSVGLMLMMLMTSFIGCGRDNKPKIGMVLSTLNNPFFVNMKDGAEKEAEKLGYDLVVLDSQNDPAKERANVEDLVQLGVIALLINPTDSDAVIKTVEVANKSNIPVITLDRQANGGKITSHIASDNIKGGEMAAEYVLDKFKDEKGPINVVEIQGIPGASATRDRGEGFHNIMDKNDKFNFISIQAADFDRQKGLQVMENIIQANPNIQVVFAHNDEMALGAVKAIKASGINALVIGFDGNDDAKDSIDANEMTATIAQQPDLIGALGVELANKIYNGESIKDKIAADLKVYTK
ncbi:ribose ABC transporter substrate-binding protein RbsB [Clostridium perfringens]|jgi:ribose transport system substrate-binding protein|uniref:Ribose ABC transporter substrate-binding protein RbsB n=1 Tax=Clostridium perfringens TaxID=1502 RepID=A0AAE8FVQ9_CLOPF|nr:MULTISPECIES: ribose ABC transporter substrate-binding protein RbsB [Clostridium]EGT3619031.1 ribose ABC transporter substrate-binding protein RbsB [Clostridium perfringens]EIF6288898.1 ribose ABC transporter substrate-binding protein RbsB [Clostridium perfringens]EJT5930021.1 ribose ABC transporter substrate-binding protein RbsB [Clostridium perfringens]EJT6161285.1 ribose ABC transporter substrate-binding protein RbsB [Clostridium perfringens]EJT6503766.1 ribose ABC transporter substrate-